MDYIALGYQHPDVRKLCDEVQQIYVERYGSPDETLVDESDFDPPTGLFLVRYEDGRALACGGWRKADYPDEPGLSASDAEIKRMYVRPEARGRGLARAMLAELESRAAAAGQTRMILETGDRQQEAIALYRSCGYVDLPKFGYYRDSPASICMAKPLPGHSPASPASADTKD
ncbi:GNAT family N-acetyltransferase [Yinghuangia soli]|uniref:GNAT family N-acetyltransferase n=1 Tax=Yinghuangia soli TaxID=2908204 RepID=A0AA41Q071_9ACTN|nr:GNAT family N-acetyltransferase [Yinghuangia soli]MCF2527652.1 GNAT family N-acetyltransferase [Yinghuangia soli]